MMRPAFESCSGKTNSKVSSPPLNCALPASELEAGSSLEKTQDLVPMNVPYIRDRISQSLELLHWERDVPDQHDVDAYNAEANKRHWQCVREMAYV